MLKNRFYLCYLAFAPRKATGEEEAYVATKDEQAAPETNVKEREPRETRGAREQKTERGLAPTRAAQAMCEAGLAKNRTYISTKNK